jgi:RND family efflux transporter MFP subunit
VNLKRNERIAMNGYSSSARRWVAGAVLGVTLATTAACGPDETAEAASEGPAVVLAPTDLVTASSTEISGGIVLTGTLNPYRIVDVKAQVPGTIDNLSVDRGDAVNAGQSMAVIQAEGIRGQAAGAAAGVAAAEANLALAQQQLESARVLHEAGAMSNLDFRGAQASYEAARAQLAAANAQAAGAGEQARRATVTAPINGEVSNRQVSEGEAVTPGQTLFTVVNSSALELAGQVPVDQAVRVRAGAPAEFTIDAYPGRVFRGTVARVEPTADPATRQVGVYLQLPNQDRSLVGGLFATGRVMVAGAEKAVVVPAAAVRGSGTGTYVWVIEEGRAVRRPVTAGVRDEASGMLSITSGVQPGDQVVVAPGDLEEGAAVRITAEAEGAAPPAEE